MTIHNAPWNLLFPLPFFNNSSTEFAHIWFFLMIQIEFWSITFKRCKSHPCIEEIVMAIQTVSQLRSGHYLSVTFFFSLNSLITQVYICLFVFLCVPYLITKGYFISQVSCSIAFQFCFNGKIYSSISFSRASIPFSSMNGTTASTSGSSSPFGSSGWALAFLAVDGSGFIIMSWQNGHLSCTYNHLRRQTPWK